MTERRCVGGCCDNRPGWEWIDDPFTGTREKRRQKPEPGQHGYENHECQPRMAQDGAYLCRGCIKYLTGIIESLPSYADDLEAAAGHSAGGSARGRNDGSPDFATSRRRIEALGQLAHDAAWWAFMVAEERGLSTLPEMDTVSHPRISVHLAAMFLARHVQWLAARPEADETLDACKTMRYEAAHAMDLPRDRARFPVGPCPEACEGTVWAYIGTEGGDCALSCDTDTGHGWEPSQFYRAGVRIKRKMGAA